MALLPLAPALLVSVVIAADAHTALPVRVVTFITVTAIMAGSLLAFFTTNRRNLTTRTGPQHKRLAAYTGHP